MAGAAPVSLFATLGNRVGAGVRVEGALNETDSAAEADYCVLQFPASFSVNPTQPAPAIYGRLYEAGSTEAAGAPPGWMAEVGYGPSGTDPRSQRSQWQFFSASYNLQVGSDDEFVASFTAPAAAGSYAYTFRFSQDQGGNWTYCDLDGAGSSPAQTFDLPNLGTMTVMTGLVINEVDYDQPGTDSAEFIEIYNASAQSVSLTGLALALINGSDNSEYRRIDLDAAAATLAAGGYLVVHTPSVTVAPGAVSLLFPAACSSDCIQNGAPDGIALIDSVNGTLIDALSYEGSVLAANIAGFPSPVNLVEGTPATVLDNNTSDGSLVRVPNGSDTNNAVSDWQFATAPTPGAAN